MEGQALSDESESPTAAPMRWSFGVEPLRESLELASLMRTVAGLVLSLEAPHPALERLAAALRSAEAELGELAPADPTPRIGPEAAGNRRVYIDHSRDIGAFNPCFPTYQLRVNGDRASGTVSFPVAYEGPPGIVHGGFLAVFFDSVAQHHNCDLGLAGKTTSLALTYRRPTPLVTELEFDVVRSVDERRIDSTARLMAGGVVLCEARVSAVAGNRAGLPEVSPRRAER
jgi:acyl-coenzyme A thioesterase PaaI-like protein